MLNIVNLPDLSANIIEARAARWDGGGGSGGARMCWPARLANTSARCRRRKS